MAHDHAESGEHLPWGVFCIENEWWGEGERGFSVKPVLNLLTTVSQFDHRHRIISTRQSLLHALEDWIELDGGKWWAAYLSLHGGAGALAPSPAEDQDISLLDLGAKLDGRCENRIIHLGACGTAARPSVMREFSSLSGARAVTGFTRSVDWMGSAALELLFWNKLSQHYRWELKRTLHHLVQRASGLVDECGFQIWSRGELVSLDG